MTIDDVVADFVSGELETYDELRAAILALVAAERKACAKVCEEIRDAYVYADKQEAANDCAAAIRARVTP